MCITNTNCYPLFFPKLGSNPNYLTQLLDNLSFFSIQPVAINELLDATREKVGVILCDITITKSVLVTYSIRRFTVELTLDDSHRKKRPASVLSGIYARHFKSGRQNRDFLMMGISKFRSPEVCPAFLPFI